MATCANSHAGGTVLVLGGPTASGKSGCALEIARRIGGEIISADSMQVFRGLEIGTAQPTPAERAEIPHHLVGILSIRERWDASRFVPAAQDAIAKAAAAGHLPIVVGGTGMYLKALCYRLPMLPSDPEVAAVLREMLATETGVASLRCELAQAAGGEAAVPHDLWLNPRRVARSVEVLRITGELSWKVAQPPAGALPQFRQLCLLPSTANLRWRIIRRTRQMLRDGWVEEALCAVEAGLLETPTAWQALGYRDIAHFMRGGGAGGEAALTELLVNRTMQYARRQLTWFRHQHPGAQFLEIEGDEDLTAAVRRADASCRQQTDYSP